ncbi:MAG TPA: LemA family protein [Verrucomicrobiae bacterium]|nr:LemA family protein [Verrucomicrobiae bacterium]
MSPLIIAAILLGLLVLWLVLAYNGLIGARNRTDESWADIDVQLKRRYDLIPNLVESVKGYIKQEKDVLENVTKARAEAIAVGSAATPAAQSKAENGLTQALRSVFAVSENYPDLKSSANFQQLSTELTDTENKIQAARRFYNTNVRDFNTKLQVIPTNIFAKSMGFTAKEFFELEEASPEREAVKVAF